MQRLFFTALLLAWSAEAFSQGYAPDVAASKMKVPDGLAVNLYAVEPDIRQPIGVKFDDRGRLWTVQYLQYPNPAGLKRVKVDRWSRTVYDRVPEPPPKGPKGADKITICEDRDGDGRADHFRDFVTGLNLCTGLAFGHGGVYVLQMPYLLFYPDRNRDDIPDSDPEVLLSGFGMEDAQSVPNHLTWGPDGWLYGVTGSTSSNLIRGIEFQQAVWRYHPATTRFELFCEGGGNLFGVTFDINGNLIFASNGNDLAYHAVQGGYYRKNFGKHGPLHNPYTYGFFEHLPYDHPVAGPRPGGMIYLGDSLPASLRGAYVCGDFLQHGASYWRLNPVGATFKAAYGGKLVESTDTWFCSPDLCQGPDGSIYFCDFHDQRTAHPDPDAQWDRSNGRIYRLASVTAKPAQALDFSRYRSQELVELLRHPNGWHREQARMQLASRRDTTTFPALAAFTRQDDDSHLALQGLWSLYVSGGFTDDTAAGSLMHPNEYVRAWTVRLLGDLGDISKSSAARLAELAASEPSVVVRSQLAATARRLTGAAGLTIVERLLRRGLDLDDPYQPMMLWWAVEARAMTDINPLFTLLGNPEAWEQPSCREITLKLLRRYAAEGSKTGYDAAEHLLMTVPVRDKPDALSALDQGLAERSVGLGGMGMGGLLGKVARPEGESVPARSFEPLSKGLRDAIAAAWLAAPQDLPALRIAARAGVAAAIQKVINELSVQESKPGRTVELLGILTIAGPPESAAIALNILAGTSVKEVKLEAISLLSNHGDDPSIAKLLSLYPKAQPELKGRLRDILLGRPASALAFLMSVDRGEIDSAEIPVDQLRQVALHANSNIDRLIRKHWGSIQPGTAEEKLAEIRRLTNDLRAGKGDRDRGKVLFTKHCATCHRLFDEGGTIGPDLTGGARGDTVALLANIVDPSAVIRPAYLSYAVVTTTGRVATGIITAQDNAGLTLADSKNPPTRFTRDEIEELRPLATSIMPEGLLKSLSAAEVRDLFSYLQDQPR